MNYPHYEIFEEAVDRDFMNDRGRIWLNTIFDAISFSLRESALGALKTNLSMNNSMNLSTTFRYVFFLIAVMFTFVRFFFQQIFRGFSETFFFFFWKYVSGKIIYVYCEVGCVVSK